MIVALSTACGPQTLPQPPVTHVPPIHLGINDAFHSALPPDIVAHDCGYGTDFTIRTPQLSWNDFDAFRNSVNSCDHLHVLALVEGSDVGLARDLAQHAEAVTSIRAIENGNELELPPHELNPQLWASVQTQMAQAERSAGWTGDIITGGVYALTEETKRAIDLVVPLCRNLLNCMIGVHLYDPSQSDIDWLNELNLDIALTETGMPTGCGNAKWQAQADYISSTLALVSQIRRLRYFLVYQRPSAATCDNLATFGLQASDGTWKPADRLFLPR